MSLALCAAALLGFVAAQSGADRARAVIDAVRAQQSYRTQFSADIRIPNSDPMAIRGEALWVSGGVLFIDYTATGGDHKRIVRVGERVWVYYEPAEEWVAPEEVGMGGAGRGVHNTDEVLATLSKYVAGARLAGAETQDGQKLDAIEIVMTGADIEKVMREQAQQGAFDWTRSKATMRALSDAANLLRRLTSSAELVSAEPDMKGQVVTYAADVRITSYNQDYLMAFPAAGAAREIPLDPTILIAIARQPGIPAALREAVAKAQETRIAKLIADLGAQDEDAVASASTELRLFGAEAVPALKKALDDKARAEAARKILAEIEAR